MKRIAVISLLGIFLWHITGVYAVWHLRRIAVRAEMRHSQQLRKNEVQLCLSPESVQWIEFEREFRYDGQLYDITSMEVDAHTGNYLLHCAKDTVETALISFLDTLTLRQMPLAGGNHSPIPVFYKDFLSISGIILPDILPNAPICCGKMPLVRRLSPYLGIMPKPPRA